MKHFRCILLAGLAACGSKPPAAQTPQSSASDEEALEAERNARTPAPAATDAEPDPSAPLANVEYSVSAERNIEKGRAAITAEDFAAARAYFQFAIDRFPFSSLVHDAELGLVETDTAELVKLGRDDADSVVGHCHFIAHHPFHPRVVNGDVACMVNKIQHTPCDANDRAAAKYCGAPDYCADLPKGEVAKHGECK